jgi:hypothetical protein
LTGVVLFRIIGFRMRAIKIDEWFMLRLVRGEDVIDCLRSFVRLRTVAGGTLTGIGAADAMTVAFYDVETREYRPQQHEGLIEVMNMTGNLSWYDGEPHVHVHVSAAEEKAGAFGGHLVSARVSAGMEIRIVPTHSRLTRLMDPATGLPQLDFPDIGKV